MGEPGLFQVVEVSLRQSVPEKQNVSLCQLLFTALFTEKTQTVPARFLLSHLLLFIKCRFIEGDSATSRAS